MIALPRVTKLVLLTAIFAALAALPTSAHATLFGIESNSEFTNSDRTPALLDQAFTRAQGQGAQVIRGNVNWADIAINCAGQSLDALSQNTNPCYNWSVLDNLVRDANLRGIRLLFSVSRSPVWVNGSANNLYVGSSSAQYNRFVNNYVAFIKAIGSRYNAGSSIGTVNLWTIWNEPNSNQFWQPNSTRAAQAATPIRYAALYAKAAVALRSVSRTALIAPGPTGPSPSVGVRAGVFITTFQKYAMKYLPGRTITAKRSYINAWAHNPYPYNHSPRDMSHTFYKLNYPNLPIQRVKDLVRVLDSSPLTRHRMIWATEFGYESNPPDRFAGIATRLQGRWMADGFDVLDATGRVSIAIWYGMTDPTNMIDFQSGSYTASGRLKPAGLWQRHPVAVNVTRVRRGLRVQVWGKSTVDYRHTILQYSTNGRTWRTVLGVHRRADFSIRANIRISAKKTWFAINDSQHVRGPSVLVAGV